MSTSTTPRVEHAAYLDHAGLALAKHVVDRSSTREQRSPFFERHPAIGPRLAKINIEGLVDPDDERDSCQRVLIELPAFGIRLPGMKGRGGDPAEQSSRLRLIQAPLRGDVHEGLQGTCTESPTLLGAGQVGSLI